MDQTVYSFSRMEKYEDCPNCFCCRYIFKIEEPTTLPLALGKATHAVAESALKLKQDSRAFFETMCDVVMGLSPLKLDKEELLLLTYQPLVLQYVGKADPDKIEHHFEAPIDPDNPFSPMLQGYIDIWQDEVDVVQLTDFKTNRKPYSPTDKHQLGLYAGYLADKTGKTVIGNLVFLRTREATDHIYSYNNGIAAARAWAMDTALEIEERTENLLLKKGSPKELFPAKPGDNCRYCGFAGKCNGEEIVIPDMIYRYDQALEVAREIFRLDQKSEILKARLRGYVKMQGPVTVGRRRFDLVPSKYWSFGGNALEKAFKKMKATGIDPFGVMSLTATGLKKVGWGESEIKELGGTLRTTINFKDVSID